MTRTEGAAGLATLCAVAALVADTGDPDALAFVRAVAAIDDGADPLRALGLKPAPGHRSIQTIERQRRRDTILRDWRQRLHGHERIGSAVAAMIGRAAVLHPRVSRMVETGSMPASYVGRADEYLFRLIEIGAEMPAKSRLRTILSAKKSNELPPIR